MDTINWNNFCGMYLLYPLLNLNDKLFKKRDSEIRDCCVYAWMYNGIVYYIGEGRIDREIKHQRDLLSRVIGPGWICVIITSNLTKKEGCIIEAYLLRTTTRTFSTRGQYIWDGVSLINKQREFTYKGVSYEVLFEEYLNLDNGNNYWETFRRQIDCY